MIKNLTKKGKNAMFTEHLTQVEEGIFVNENATSASSELVEEHYTKQAIKILDDDRHHYECLLRKFKESPIFSKEFYSVADIAGGHPKLASLMNVSGEITVYDQYSSMYKKLHKEFLKRYPTEASVKYVKKSVTHPNFTPNAEVAVLSHILEHLELEQIRRMLKNLETDKIIVYGPNIGVARNRNWFHFRPSDHKTFATLDAMKRLIEEAGFKTEFAVAYQEDYMIYGDK